MAHPILADFHPKGGVAKSFDVYNEETGLPRRSVFVIDKEGVVRFSTVYTSGLPAVDDVIAELDKIA